MTSYVLVFRIKGEDGNPVFLDCQLRKYESWEKYLKNNKSPPCIMCFPKDGFLRKMITGSNGQTSFKANDLIFGEPPSCSLPETVKRKFDTVLFYAVPIIAVVACPDSFPVVASILSSMPTSTLKVGGEEGRALTEFEFFVITGLLRGMCVDQVASFACMTIHLAVIKPKLEPMDIIGYVVACHNLYSCIMSPKSAENLLKKIQDEITSEYTNEKEKEEKEQKEQQKKKGECGG